MIQTELHRHLDVSARPATLLKLAQERGLEAQSTSLEAFREKLILRKPLNDLREVLAQFTLYQKVLDRPEVLAEIAFEVVEDCYREGTRKAELRFSPGFVCELNQLSWETALDGFQSGVNRALGKYPDMKAGLICIGTRDYGPEEIDRTVEFYLRNQLRFIGLDLAGNENGFPCRLFETSFRKAKAAGAKITVHAGEGSGPENIWEAVELLGAQRIGHGIACVQDPKLMEMLKSRGICLEMCPTSNFLTRAVSFLSDHPLPRVLRAGIPVCINTDDPGIFGVTLPQEVEVCRTEMKMTAGEIDQCFAHAATASFIA